MTLQNQGKITRCVIATSRAWNERIASQIKAKTGTEFEIIRRPEELTIANLERINPRYVFFPHWSNLIPEDVYSRFECIIFHVTDVPFGRGGSPLQNLIARGIYETQVSALKCVRELDGGPVYLKMPLSLNGAAEEIYLRAGQVVEKMIVEIIQRSLVPTPQVGEPVVFKRRKPEDGSLQSLESMTQVFDTIRMLDADGYPPAFLDFGPFRLHFSRAALKADGVLADVKISMREVSRS